MKLFIPKDIFDNPKPPRLFLCTTGKKRIGELHNYETNLTGKWNSYSELTFSIDRTYVDILTGETKVNPLFDKAEGLRIVLAENMGYFIVQDPDTTIGEKDVKALSCFSTEYACGQKYLDNFYINTGDVASKEVIYEQNKYGEDVKPDHMYKLASASKYDSNEKYYVRDYTDSDSYTYTQIQIKDEVDYKKHFGTDISSNDILYIHGYANVQFYDPYTPELSLLHLIFENIPDWKIGHVDTVLWHKERKLEQERIAVYDFLMNDVSEVFECVVEWDTLTNTVNFYEEADDGITDNGTVQSRFETDVFISKDNLASEINIKYSTDNIKTRLKVSGADNLDIREVNLGQNYIMNLDYYHNDDWMEPDLVEAYQRYLDAVTKYSPQYEAAMQGWVEANDKYNELMNAVPAEGNVVLVGDEFKKLYCTYTPINTAYYNNTLVASTLIAEQSTISKLYADEKLTMEIDKTALSNGDQFVVQGLQFKYSNGNFVYVSSLIANSVTTLVGTEDKNYKNGKLYLYNVFEDIEANESDNILLTLKNANSDKATIRIYNAGTKQSPDYLIQSIVVSATTGISMAPKTYTMQQWASGKLTADLMELNGYTISSIGTMGAYFVLAKDETEEATLEEYGINLLQEKHNTYVKIFQTQTEAMYSQQDYQCIVQNEQPDGEYDNGTKWLDTNSNPVKLYEYNTDKKVWNEISATNEVSSSDEENYRNYQRYIDNYDKMVAVQKMLIKKKKEAEYWDGGEKLNKSIIYNGGSDIAFYEAAKEHFGAVTRGTLNTGDVILTYTFTTPNAEGEWVIYLDGTTPYLMHLNSQGYWNAKKNAISKLTEFKNFFTSEQWAALSPLIREDEYNDDNFLLTTYESEEERLDICRQLMEGASKELKTLSQPSLEFSMTMANILALPEFNPLVRGEQFALGNFIRIGLHPGLIKRSRLLECSINFDDLSDFNCTFGNLVTTKSEIDLHAELLSQAVQAGKTVATAAGTWQAGADKANKLEEAISNGLQDVTLQVGRASGQAISWGGNGLYCRKFKDGSTEEYDDEQIAIINNKILYSSDGFKTSKSAFGSFEYEGQRYSGVLAEAVVGGLVQGATIHGGNLRIGDGTKNYFEVNEAGEVRIVEAGQEKYASTSDLTSINSAVNAINNTYKYHVVLEYTNSTIFNNTTDFCEITCKVFDYEKDITSQVLEQEKSVFAWKRSSSDSNSDATWVPTYNGAKNKIKIETKDVIKNSTFSCEVDFDETKITT